MHANKIVKREKMVENSCKIKCEAILATQWLSIVRLKCCRLISRVHKKGIRKNVSN